MDACVNGARELPLPLRKNGQSQDLRLFDGPCEIVVKLAVLIFQSPEATCRRGATCWVGGLVEVGLITRESSRWPARPRSLCFFVHGVNGVATLCVSSKLKVSCFVRCFGAFPCFVLLFPVGWIVWSGSCFESRLAGPDMDGSLA